VTTVALGGTAVLALSASVLIGASGVSSAAPASPSGNSGAVSYTGMKAAESAFQAAGTTADPVACQRPAPDNRVSTTLHCYTPNDIRAFYGLDPLSPDMTLDSEGLTIVLVDAYGTPTGAEDLAFFAKTLQRAYAQLRRGLPAG
jgi:subtilase family serine protease